RWRRGLCRRCGRWLRTELLVAVIQRDGEVAAAVFVGAQVVAVAEDEALQVAVRARPGEDGGLPVGQSRGAGDVDGEAHVAKLYDLTRVGVGAYNISST